MEEARAMEENINTIWTDGSRLEDGRVGAGVVWYENCDEDPRQRLITTRTSYRTAGRRRDGAPGYLGGRRSVVTRGKGWRS